MKSKILKSVALAASLISGSAFAAFDGDYDVSNWTQTPGTGSIDLSNVATLDTLTLIGGNDGSGSQSSTIFSIAITASGTLNFAWNYSTAEANSFWDPFGYELNGTITQLTTNGNAAGSNQSGIVSIAVSAGDIFGFRQTTRDNVFGGASTSISNFSAPSLVTSPVPLPPSFGFLGFALGGLVMMQRRDRR